MHKRTFPASIDHLHHMLIFVQSYCQKLNLEERLTDRITLAAEEAIVNVIRYGYPEGEGEIEISCELIDNEDKKALTIYIKDHGIPFDAAEAFTLIKKKPRTLHRDLVDIESSEGGYGIYIYSGIMDRVEYQRLNQENLLSLIKYI